MKPNLDKYIKEYMAIQNMQIKATGYQGFLPDIRQMAFERKKAFENLRNAIAESSHKELLKFADMGKHLLRNDQILQKQIESYKNEIFKKINNNNKGKKILKGYMGYTGTRKRFINLKE